MRKVQFLDVGWTYRVARDEYDAAYRRVMDSGVYIQGEEVAAFEREFMDFLGSGGAVGVSSGLDALHLILKALGIGPGDEVIVPGHTFIATWLSVSATGAEVVPVDVDPETMNMDLDCIEVACSERTKAILAVHLYGNPLDMDRLSGIAEKHKIPIIEDAAQAHGSKWRGQPVGSFGIAGAFSFYPGKNLGAFGDGGAVVSDDDKLLQAVRILANYGSKQKYHHDVMGYNNRLDPLQAAFLRVKLKYLPEWNARRRDIAKRYNAELEDLSGLSLPEVHNNAESAWHLYVIQVQPKDRNLLKQKLEERGVFTHIHYPIPPHKTKAYLQSTSSRKIPALPETERMANSVLSLPLGPHLDDEDVTYVISQVKQCIAKK